MRFLNVRWCAAMLVGLMALATLTLPGCTPGGLQQAKMVGLSAIADHPDLFPSKEQRSDTKSRLESAAKTA